MNNELQMMRLNFTKQEERFIPLQEEFNNIAKSYYPDILGWNHYDLHIKCIKEWSSPQVWKEFLMNPKVKQWYDEEQILQIRTSVMKLLQDIGSSEGKSTGQAQALSTMLSQLNKSERIDTTTKYIYNFIPLTELEKDNPNVRILKFIPDEIRNAVQIIGTDGNNKKE